MSALLDRVKNYFMPEVVSKEQSFTWTHFDLAPELVQEIQEIYTKELNPDPDSYNFYQWLPVKVPDINGLRVHKAALIYCRGNEKPRFSHKDPIPPDRVRGGGHRDWAPIVLNIPLRNCENSRTSLYKDVKDLLHILTPYNEPAVIMPIEECKLLTSFVLDRPILFNTQVLHAVENFSPEPRFAISLRFKESPYEWL
jgi:hypothetical protein